MRRPAIPIFSRSGSWCLIAANHCALPGPPHRPWNQAIRLHHKALLFHKVRAVPETLICLREAYVAIPSVGEDVWLSVRVTEPKTKVPTHRQCLCSCFVFTLHTLHQPDGLAVSFMTTVWSLIPRK